jgi:hypothetical protein
MGIIKNGGDNNCVNIKKNGDHKKMEETTEYPVVKM